MSFLLVSLDIIKMTKNVISGCVWVEGVVSAFPPRKYLVIRHGILKQYNVCAPQEWSVLFHPENT